MLKKRVIFTLLFSHGNYMLSRNFRLQKVGDLTWLKKNYVFSRISFSIDELIVLNVSRGEKDEALFKQHIGALTKECFIPIAAGGGITEVEQARQLLRSGADKVVLNTSIATNPELVNMIAGEFGQQCIIASVDIKKEQNCYYIYVNNGDRKLQISILEYLSNIINLPVGEIYLNSIDRDGTGQGYLFELLDIIEKNINVPLIMAGGAGNYHHFSDGLLNDKIDAVATAHLFNFLGNGFLDARKKLIQEMFDLPVWDTKKTKQLKDCLKS